MTEPTQLEIAPRKEMAVAQVEPQGLSIERAFQAVISNELDKDKLAVMKELLQMDAEKKFNVAFIELQKALPAIRGFRGIPDKQGNVKFVYANFDDIDFIVRPICLQHGFSYSFREHEIKEGRITMIMDLQHCAGHSRPIPYSVRIGSGPPGASESQADVSGHTYAKRGALESGLSLRIIGEREDARMEGDPTKKITAAQADELERRVHETNSDVKAFLRFAGVGISRFDDIPENRYAELDSLLSRKEKLGR